MVGSRSSVLRRVGVVAAVAVAAALASPGVATASSRAAVLRAAVRASDSGDSGYSVAISGDTAVVGAVRGFSAPGAAFVFVRSGTAWRRQATLTPSDPSKGDGFGAAVAIFGDIAVVGAPNKNSRTGAAYVFERTATGWHQRAKLTASDGASVDDFGFAVGITQTSAGTAGTTVLVGAPGHNVKRGAAYAFFHTRKGWRQGAKLTASNAAQFNEFGDSVGVSGTTAVIGASGRGEAYVFVRGRGRWRQAKQLASGVKNDNFGLAVAISDNTAVVCSRSSTLAAAYVFVRSDGQWRHQAKLTAPNVPSGDEFCSAVAISGSTAVVGAAGNDPSVGAAYVFERTGTVWREAKLPSSDAAVGDEFGFAVGISGDTAVVGAFAHSAGSGAGYVFARSPTGWRQQAVLTAG